MVKTGKRLWAMHPHVRSGDQLSIGERAADVMKHWFGTWTALGVIVGAIAFWLLAIHDPGNLKLNLGLSFLASVQGVILQIAANRGDRIGSEVAAGTNANTAKLLELQEQQMAILAELREVRAAVEDAPLAPAMERLERKDTP